MSTSRVHWAGVKGQPAPGELRRGQALVLAEPRTYLGRLAPQHGYIPSSGGFLSGVLAGFLGAGIAGAFTGHGLTAGLTGFPGFLGLFMQILILTGISGAALMVFRRLPRMFSPAFASVTPSWSFHGAAGRRLGPRFAARAGQVSSRTAGVAVTASDCAAFEALLKNVQAAWGRQDIPGLQQLCTYDMVQHYADALARLASRGLRNQVRDVTMERGDVAETWREGQTDYVSVSFRYSLIDVTRRTLDGVVMTGDPVRRAVVVEIWTFCRRGNLEWRLAAVQQVQPPLGR